MSRLRVVAGVGLALAGWLLFGCAKSTPTTEPSPPGARQTPAATLDPAPTPKRSISPSTKDGLGSSGLTVRYLDRNGEVRTLPVEKFPR